MNRFRSFGSDTRGNTGLMFGLAMIPLLAAVGATTDYSRAADTRTKMQAVADTAAMALAHKANVMNPAQLRTEGEALVRSLLADKPSLAIGSVNVVKNNTTIRIEIAGAVAAHFGALFGSNSMPVGAKATAAWGVKKMEIALALDNTGSMNSNGKIGALKTAVNNFVNVMEAASTGPGTIKISLVPFATKVKVGAGYNSASWLRSDLLDPWEVNNWEGCVTDRDQSYDVDDTAPSAGVLATLYPKVQCSGVGSLAEVRGLSDNYNALRSHAQSMLASGNTNVPIGIAWGHATLSPGEPFTGASTFGDPDVDKFMIVLTDGDNTQNRWTNNQSSIDTRMTLACDAVKAKNIKLYTIRVINGNANLLRNCATNTNMYYDVQNAGQLDPVFQQIAAAIKGIRLTN